MVYMKDQDSVFPAVLNAVYKVYLYVEAAVGIHGQWLDIVAYIKDGHCLGITHPINHIHADLAARIVL